jgi:Ca-activated chloride channel family protein
MEFKWYGLLPLLIIIPLLIAFYVWVQRRRVKYALRYSSLALVKEAMGKGPGIRRHIPPAIFLIALTAMIVALARPQAVITLPKQEATVILAIDVSGSMRANDLKPSRFEAAKIAARAFIERQAPDTRVGVVAFAGSAALVQAPTTDHEQALAAINRLSLGPRTAIGSAIMIALDAIFEPPDIGMTSSLTTTAPLEPTPTPLPVPRGMHVPAIVVLLTDGQSNTGILPLDAAQIAADRGVRVFTIGAGTVQGANVQFGGGFGGGRGFRTFLDEATLKKIADLTDAEYFHASDENALVEIYRNLKTELIVQTERQEITFVFTAAAVLLLIFGGALSLLWFNRLP